MAEDFFRTSNHALEDLNIVDEPTEVSDRRVGADPETEAQILAGKRSQIELGLCKPRTRRHEGIFPCVGVTTADSERPAIPQPLAAGRAIDEIPGRAGVGTGDKKAAVVIEAGVAFEVENMVESQLGACRRYGDVGRHADVGRTGQLTVRRPQGFGAARSESSIHVPQSVGIGTVGREDAPRGGPG